MIELCQLSQTSVSNLLSAAILPLATAYNICEGLDAKSGVNSGAGIVLVPGLPLIKFILFSQVANGALLPFLLVFMLILVNRKELMGQYTNSGLANVVAWGTTIIIIVLTSQK